jgi:hypothetical protein
MPALLAAAIVSIGAGAVTIATATIIAQGVFLLGSFALSSYQARKEKQKARDKYNAQQVDRLVSVSNTISARELVMGRVRKGGTVFFRTSTGQYNTTAVVHIALAGHEIDAVEQIYFNDQAITLDADGYVTSAPYYRPTTPSAFATIPAGSTSVELAHTPVSGSVALYRAEYAGTGEIGSEAGSYLVEGADAGGFTVSGTTVTLNTVNDRDIAVSYQYAVVGSWARVKVHLGTADQLAPVLSRALVPELVGENYRARGVAYLECIFFHNDSVYPNGVPNVTATVRGAKLYDPRTLTTAWSENPALQIRHVYQHANFGKATVSAEEDARFVAQANACDVSHGYVVNGVTETTQLFRANMVVPYGSPAWPVIEDLAQTMGGRVAWAGGELHLTAGVAGASVMALTDADLATIQRDGEQERQEPIHITAHQARADKFNTVNLRIWDAEQEYKQVALTPVQPAALVADDGGQVLAQEVTLPGVFYAPQAQHVAGIMLRDARDPLKVEAWFKLRAYPLELFDVVTLTLARFGWVAKEFMVLQREWDLERGAIKLSLKETAASIFTPDAAFLPQGYAANTGLPSPWTIDPPGALTVSSGTEELLLQGDGTIVTRVRVTWPAIADGRITQDGFVEVQWASASSQTWQSVQPVDGSNTSVHILGIADGQGILVRARTRTPLAVSDWGGQKSHVVVGKSEPPADVGTFAITGRSLSWTTAAADVDLAGAEIRFNYGNNLAWGSATPLHSGVLAASPWMPPLMPPGLITLLIKNIDTSGNYSVSAAVIVANLGDVLTDNIVETYDDAASGFAGTKTNCTVSGGDLVADDSGDLFWGDSNANFWSGGAASLFWPTATYLALTYVLGHAVTAAEADARLTLDHTIEASSYTIEFRYDTQGAFWGVGTDAFWGADGDPFWEPPTAWQVWPGELLDVGVGTIEFRITTQAGLEQGVVSALTLNFDVEDEFEELDDVAVGAAGVRLAITKSYRSIKNIQLTLQDDGGTAISAQWVDKDATLGPLVQCINSAGTLVAGVLDARIQGVKG